jgi:hypothetical protein
MAPYDALELHLIDQKRPEYVRPAEGVSIEEELRRFLGRGSDYERAWVKVEGDKYVRYDRVASVAVARGLDDETGPLFDVGKI